MNKHKAPGVGCFEKSSEIYRIGIKKFIRHFEIGGKQNLIVDAHKLAAIFCHL